tara:strand:- start:128 stop:499 length:372 start_codon:yes stop_codon:yes gene_type:complete
MRNILKFERKSGEYKTKGKTLAWETHQGIHYLCYPFFIYKREDHWVLTHVSSGAEVCNTDTLTLSKYIATRLLPIPQFLLPHKDLVSYMTQEQKSYCMNIISRYREASVEDMKRLDKNCPLAI